MKRTAAFLSLLTLLAACEPGDGGHEAPDAAPGSGAGADATEAGPGGEAPEGYGTLALALEAKDAVAGAFTAHILFFAEGATTPTVERTLPLSGVTLLDYVYLAEGVWSIEVAVVDESGTMTLMTGSADGVGVVAGQTTSVGITLVPSGAVQIVASIDRRGLVFQGAKGAATLPKSWAQVAGTQRIQLDTATGKHVPRYTMYLRRADGSSWDLATSFDPGALDLTKTKVVTGLPGKLSCGGFAPLGDGFIALCASSSGGFRAELYTSGDGQNWTHDRSLGSIFSQPPVTKVPSPFGGYAVLDNLLGSCGLLIDNQFNVFCGAVDAYSAKKVLSQTETATWKSGVFHAWSLDGGSWSDFPPLLVDSKDNPSGLLEDIDKRVHVQSFGSIFSSATSPGPGPVIVGLALEGGVYRMWVSDSQPGGLTIRLFESLDRMEWTLGKSITTGSTAPAWATDSVAPQSFATFFGEDAVHVWGLRNPAALKSTAQVLWHLTSVD